jgi:hypothetical protein
MKKMAIFFLAFMFFTFLLNPYLAIGGDTFTELSGISISNETGKTITLNTCGYKYSLPMGETEITAGKIKGGQAEINNLIFDLANNVAPHLRKKGFTVRVTEKYTEYGRLKVFAIYKNK